MKVKDLCLTALFGILLAIGAFIKLPISIVPITMQTFFVCLIGLVLPRKYATMSVVLYILLGLLGLPVFASGCGPSYVLTPSFGYLIGFVICVYFMSSFIKDLNNKMRVWVISLIGLMIIYLIGMIYFYYIQIFVYNMQYELSWLFTYLFLVYLPGDIISMAIAIMISKRIKTVINRA